MKKKVFFPQYAKAGSAEMLAEYSVGMRRYKIFLLTIDDDEENKIIHDEREKGKLEIMTAEDAMLVNKKIEIQIARLKKEIGSLEKKKQQNQYIVNVLQGNANQHFQTKEQKTYKSCSDCNHHQIGGKKKIVFVLNTPLGFVVKDENDINFSKDISKALTFESEKEAICFGIETFQNQLPFIVQGIDASKKNIEDDGFADLLFSLIPYQFLNPFEENNENK